MVDVLYAIHRGVTIGACVCCNSTSVEKLNEGGAFFPLHTGKKRFSTLSLNNSTGVEKTPDFSSVFSGENTSFLVQSGVNSSCRSRWGIIYI